MSNRNFDEFTKAYLETALWSSSDDDDKPLDEYNSTDIADETINEMIKDCEKFQSENCEDISSDLSRAGHDFWLTRNHHGAGFWDGDWEIEIGKKLTKASETYGEFTLYVGDDGKIYGM
jgi:hypothetical protein